MAGILVEAETTADHSVFFIGVGLNINAKETDLKGVSQSATSLFLESGRIFSIDHLLEALSKRFQSYLETFIREGFAPFHASYAAYFTPFVGKRIRLQITSKEEVVVIEGVNEDGSLRCCLESGQRIDTFSGILLDP